MDSPEHELLRFGRDLRETLSMAQPSTELLRQVRRELIEEVAIRNQLKARSSRARASRRRRGWMLVALGTAVAAAVTLALLRSPVAFRVGATGARGRTGDVIETTTDAPLPLTFSEGSSIVLRPGSRLRVLAMAASGARVLVESGTVDVAIAHRRMGRTNWQFEVGPFHVEVTGTRFDVRWAPADERLDLNTQEGSVVISGGCIHGRYTVLAGQQLRMSCRPSSAATDSAEEPATPPSPAIAPARTDAGHENRGRPPWRDLLASGHLLEALWAAEDAPFDHVCRVASSRELFALSDAARLSGRVQMAREALRALRLRFPHTPHAANAAFALGRMAFDEAGACDQAARWFSIYLHEQPSGPLMGDATGRLMEARHCAGDRAGARAEAQRYLERFPQGPYADKARSILGGS